MLREVDLTPTPVTLDWTADTVERATSITGIVVGKVRKFRCHIYGKITKPCVRFTSNDELPCVCEQRRMEIRTTGYLPIITKDKDRRVIVLSAVATAVAERCVQGSVYTFKRPKTVKSRIQISNVGSDEAQAAGWDRLRPKKNQDITEFLCHLWQLHDLTKWCGFVPRRSLAADAVKEITEKPYEPRFVRGVLRAVGTETVAPEVA